MGRLITTDEGEHGSALPEGAWRGPSWPWRAVPQPAMCCLFPARKSHGMARTSCDIGDRETVRDCQWAHDMGEIDLGPGVSLQLLTRAVAHSDAYPSRGVVTAAW